MTKTKAYAREADRRVSLAIDFIKTAFAYVNHEKRGLRRRVGRRDLAVAVDLLEHLNVLCKRLWLRFRDSQGAMRAECSGGRTYLVRREEVLLVFENL
jgi:hypothetical protein